MSRKNPTTPCGACGAPVSLRGECAACVVIKQNREIEALKQQLELSVERMFELTQTVEKLNYYLAEIAALHPIWGSGALVEHANSILLKYRTSISRETC